MSAHPIIRSDLRPHLSRVTMSDSAATPRLRVASAHRWGASSRWRRRWPPPLSPITEDVPLDLIETRTFGSRVIYERYGRARDESD